LQDLKKSENSLRQQLRNPSGRTVGVIVVLTLIVLGATLGPRLYDGIQNVIDNRPELLVVEPGPPPHQWSDQQAFEFFRDYAVPRPPPDGVEIQGVESCWDYALTLSESPPQPAKALSSVSSGAFAQGASVPLWNVIVGDSVWRFWENTRSVVGPC
jgi:hypothetical protein